MPTVGWVRQSYIGCLVEAVVDILFDDAGLAYGLTPQKDDFDFCLACHSAAYRMIHTPITQIYNQTG